MCQLILLFTLLLIGVSEGSSIAKRQSSDEPNYQQLLDQVIILKNNITRLRSITAKLLGAETEVRLTPFFIQCYMSTLLCIISIDSH